MKICFVLQRKFAWIAHALAANVSEKNQGVECCGYATSRKAEQFLRSQNDLAYTKLIVDEDFHRLNEPADLGYIASLEKKYGEPNLWKFITVDRTIMMRIPPLEYTMNPTPRYTHDEMLRLLQLKFKTIVKFLVEEKPDALVMSAVASLGTRAIYHVAKSMGIKTITIEPTRTKNLVALSESYLTLTDVNKKFAELQTGSRQSPKRAEAAAFLNEFRKSYTTYAPQLAKFHPLEKAKFLLPWNAFRSLSWILKLTWEHIRGLHKNDYAEETPWDIIKSRVARKLRGLYGYSDLYDAPNWNEDYAYYQLHYEPELALMLYAPSWTDQIEVIRHIARSLPVHYKLCVREHRAMVNFRPRAFYKELKKIPNVKLIDPAVDLFDLMNAAKLVTVITSTAGWEAALMGKPVITFGDVYYNALSMVKKCANVEELPQLVQQQLRHFNYNEEEMVNYLSAIFEDAISVDYHRLWELEFDYAKIKSDEGLQRLANLIARKLSLTPKASATSKN